MANTNNTTANNTAANEFSEGFVKGFMGEIESQIKKQETRNDIIFYGKVAIGIAAVATLGYVVYDAVTSEKVTIIDTSASNASYNWM